MSIKFPLCYITERNLLESHPIMNLCVQNRFRTRLLNSLFRYSSSNPTEALEASEKVFLDDADASAAREAEIEAKRNKSRLSKAHFNLVNDRRPYVEPKIIAHLTVKYNRKLYGKYGSSSGINPSLCWPSKQDIADIQEYESVAHPFTIPQMMDMAAEKQQAQQLKIDTRENELAVKFSKLEQWKKDLNDKLKKKKTEAMVAKDKKERLVEEVRRHFGFKLDPRDERFQEMLAKREKEQKKLDKLAKRDAKEKVLIAKLQQKNADIDKAQ